jgi:hypothetical protein
VNNIKTENNPLEYQSDNFDVCVNNSSLINNLKQDNLQSTEPILFSSLPLQVQADIRQAQKEAAEGYVVSNEEVFKKIDRWLEKN